MNEKAATFPVISEADDIEGIRDRFHKFIGWLDKQENKIIGDSPFPFDDLNMLGTLDQGTAFNSSKETIEGWIWKLNNCISRVDIQANRIDQIVAWIETRLNEIKVLIPREVFAFMDKEEAFCKMALEYGIIKYLMKERKSYKIQQIQWRNISENLDRKSKFFWHLITKENKNG